MVKHTSTDTMQSHTDTAEEHFEYAHTDTLQENMLAHLQYLRAQTLKYTNIQLTYIPTHTDTQNTDVHTHTNLHTQALVQMLYL